VSSRAPLGVGPTEAVGVLSSDRMSEDDAAGLGNTRDARDEVMLRVALDLAGEHDLDQIIERVVVGAAEVAGARFAALGVYDQAGRIERFVHHGIDAATVERIGKLPEGRGLLGEVIVGEGPICLADLTADPRSCGFPDHHPPMHSFLGVPVRRGDRRFGNLYLTEKPGGFDDDDERRVVVLAAFAAAAVESVRLAAAEERARADRDLLGRVIGAQEAERARVSRDLHDEIGQSLTSVLLGQRLVLDALEACGPGVGEVRDRAEEVRQLAADALVEVRRLAFELRPIVLDDVGLIAAVRRLASDLAERHGFDVRIILDGLGEDTRLGTEVETVVYRVVQEALTNVARHAAANRAQAAFTVAGGVLLADVVDDGTGFEVTAELLDGSLGLVGMVERAGLVDGRIEISSEPGHGTTVHLEVPVG